MSEVILKFKPEAYKFLNNTLTEHSRFISQLKVGDLIKESLYKDISKIKITLHNAQKGGVNVINSELSAQTPEIHTS